MLYVYLCGGKKLSMEEDLVLSLIICGWKCSKQSYVFVLSIISGLSYLNKLLSSAH